VHVLAEVHETPASTSSDAGPAVGWRRQVPWEYCSAAATGATTEPENPTAVQLAADGHETPLRMVAAGRGVP